MSTAALPEKVEEQGPGISRFNHSRWNVVPPTIDSATTSAMIVCGVDRLNPTIAELTQAIEREVEKCAEAQS
jgi:hypothetical protein